MTAHGLHSHVVVNLKAAEAVALQRVIDAHIGDLGLHHYNDDARAAFAKLRAAADRAKIPWSER